MNTSKDDDVRLDAKAWQAVREAVGPLFACSNLTVAAYAVKAYVAALSPPAVSDVAPPNRVDAGERERVKQVVRSAIHRRLRAETDPALSFDIKHRLSEMDAAVEEAADAILAQRTSDERGSVDDLLSRFGLILTDDPEMDHDEQSFGRARDAFVAALSAQAANEPCAACGCRWENVK